MGNSLAPLLEAGLKTLEGLLGGPTITWRGDEIPCVVSTERSGTILEVGGMAEEVALTIIVRKSLIQGPITVDSTIILVDREDIFIGGTGSMTPKPGKPVIRNGKRLRILTVREPSTGSHYALDCASAKR
jgi:hypothetical protein